MNPCILIVEDDHRLRKFFAKTLEGRKLSRRRRAKR
jgi:hypothetical protein